MASNQPTLENRTATNDDRKITFEEIKEFLGTPPLTRGESEEAFWKWFSVFADDHQPESFSDWLEVHDYAVKQWEQNRLQRSHSALIEGVIQLIRAQQWEKSDPIEGLAASAKALRHLASMDRYERCALTKRRKQPKI